MTINTATKSTTTQGKAVLVTGANRAVGQALVEEALRRGANDQRRPMRR
jgi:FlaA1/EpsC-like NDP-sugar epimerase